jgi:hypothetical protein
VIDAAGNQSAAVEVVAGPPGPELVAPGIDRTVASTVIDTASFLYDGNDPLQVGIDPQIIEPERVAVIRGEVLDRNGSISLFIFFESVWPAIAASKRYSSASGASIG